MSLVRKQPHAVFHCAHIRTTMSHVQETTFGRLEGGELDRLGKDVVAMREKLIVKEVSGCASRDAQCVNISPAKCFSLYDFNAHAADFIPR